MRSISHLLIFYLSNHGNMNACKHLILLICMSPGACMLSAQTAPGNALPVTVDIKNEAAVNTEGLDFSPTFYEDGIVFISTNPAGLKKRTDEQLKLPAMSILRSRRNADGPLQTPEPFAKELSSLYHEGPVCFDRTAETIYFSRNSLIGGKVKIAKDDIQKMRLYTAQKSGAVWSEPVPLPFNNNEFDDCHPAISIDGDKLFFSSNRPGGFGGMDIYVAYRVGESWSEPVNLGAEVNSKGNEAFPFIHADNTLYYASDGLEGKGGLDMYYVIPDGSEWTKPVNMGEPFNSTGDDFGLIVDLNKINGYFSTNGQTTKGGDDVFSFHTENGNLDDFLLQNQRVPDRNLDLEVTVTDKISSQILANADVRVLNYDANTVIGRDEKGNLITIQKVNGQDVMLALPPDKGITGQSDNEGKFTTEVKPGNYVVIVSKEEYQTKQLRLTISKPGNALTAALEKAAFSGKVRWNASVFNYVTNAPLAGAMLVLTNPATNTKDTVIADANGLIDHYLERSTKYQIDLYQSGRHIGNTDINTEGWSLPNQIMMQNFSVAPLMPGTVIELPNIYYNFNDATLRPDARKDLDLLISLLKQQPTVKIELASHTDARGTARYNEDLSQRRADGVVEYLIEKGIAKDRLSPVGYGESEPRNRCRDGVNCTEQEHARNRRTEVRILTGIQGASMVYVDGKPTFDGPSANPNSPNSGNTDPSTVQGSGNVPKKNVNTAPPNPVSVSSGDSDQYFVIAGSFQEEERANNHMKTLQSAGHNDVKIVRFPNSPYHSVCVQSFNSRQEAYALKRQLDKENIDSFVRAVPKS